LMMTTGGGAAGNRRLISGVALATPVPWFLMQLPLPLPTLTRALMVALVYGMADSLGLRWPWTGAAARKAQAGATAGKTG